MCTTRRPHRTAICRVRRRAAALARIGAQLQASVGKFIGLAIRA
jgi:hypothetical protein